jgi:starch-binding outer membrane protein, SusD/RagB family
MKMNKISRKEFLRRTTNLANNNSGFDFPVLRYTDVYLLYAETLAEISGNVPSESLDILNEVCNRAGLPSLTTSDVSDIASFRIAMEKERRSELMFECVCWFDLVRTGKAVKAPNALNKGANEKALKPQTRVSVFTRPEMYMTVQIPENELN